MLGDAIKSILPTLQAHAESTMGDTVIVCRPGEPTTASNGTVTNPLPEVWQGKATWKPATTAASETEVGTAVVVVSGGVLKLPAGSVPLLPGDLIECTASDLNPHLVGSRAVVKGRFDGSSVTANRYSIEEV